MIRRFRGYGVRAAWVAAMSAVMLFAAFDASAQTPRFLKETFPGGFKLKEPVKFYDTGNLYEYIDGQAVFYLSYQFKQLEHGYYERNGATYYVDVYELGSTLSAFGSFRQQREPDAEKLAAGTEGAISDYLAVFYKGPFYIEIIPMDSGDADKEAMTLLAGHTASNIKDAAAPPSEIGLFPKQGLVEGSERYVDENLISYTFMGRGLVAHYKIPGAEKEVRVFIAMPGDETKAKAIFDEYKGKLQEPGELKIGNAGARGSEPYRGTTFIAVWKTYVIGCLDVTNDAASAALLETVLANLKK